MYNKEYSNILIKYNKDHPKNTPLGNWRGIKFEHYQPKNFTIMHDTLGIHPMISDSLQETYGEHPFDEKSVLELHKHGPYSIDRDNNIKVIRPIYKEVFNSNNTRYNGNLPQDGDNHEHVNNILSHLVEHYHSPIAYIHLDNIPESMHHDYYDRDSYTTELPSHNHEFKVSGEHYLADIDRNHLSIHHLDYIPEHVHTKLKEIEDTR